MTIMYFNVLTIFGHFFANCVVIFQKTEVQTVILNCLTGLNQEFKRNDRFFPSEFSKHTSARKKLNLSLKYWFLEANVVFWICYSCKKWSKYLLDTIQSTSCKTDSYKRAISVNNNFSHVWKCIISGLVCRSEFLQFRRKPAVIFTKFKIQTN